MKKLVLLLLAILCMALFSCGDEVVVPNEKVTEEVVTPDEQVAHEVAISDELSAEPIATESVRTDDGIIILPEADENTKYITIEFPEDYPEEMYVEPNLVSPEEFEWGEYVPFFRLQDLLPTFPLSFSIVSKNYPTLNDGEKLYSKLNEKFLEEYTGEKLNNLYGDEITNAVSDYLYKSRVVYVSPEADIIGRFKLIPSNDYPSEGNWHGQYDIFLNNKIEHSFFHHGITDNYMGIGDFVDYLNPIKQYFYDKNGNEIIAINNAGEELYQSAFSKRTKGIVFSKNTFGIVSDDKTVKDKTMLYFCSPDRAVLTHVISFDFQSIIDNDYQSIVFYSQDGDLQLIQFNRLVNGYYTEATYSFDLNTEEMAYVEALAKEPFISPDGDYLLYRGSVPGVDIVDGNLNSLPQREGIFIKNLKNGTTVNYPIVQFYGGGFIGWVNEEKLMNLINE